MASADVKVKDTVRWLFSFDSFISATKWVLSRLYLALFGSIACSVHVFNHVFAPVFIAMDQVIEHVSIATSPARRMSWTQDRRRVRVGKFKRPGERTGGAQLPRPPTFCSLGDTFPLLLS